MARTYGTQVESASSALNPGSAVTVTFAADVLVAGANPGRALLILTNDGANPVYLSFGGTAAISVGPRLNANGGALTIKEYTGAIRARAAIADTVIGVAEV